MTAHRSRKRHTECDAVPSWMLGTDSPTCSLAGEDGWERWGSTQVKSRSGSWSAQKASHVWSERLRDRRRVTSASSSCTSLPPTPPLASVAPAVTAGLGPTLCATTLLCSLLAAAPCTEPAGGKCHAVVASLVDQVLLHVQLHRASTPFIHRHQGAAQITPNRSPEVVQRTCRARRWMGI